MCIDLCRTGILVRFLLAPQNELRGFREMNPLPCVTPAAPARLKERLDRRSQLASIVHGMNQISNMDPPGNKCGSNRDKPDT